MAIQSSIRSRSVGLQPSSVYVQCKRDIAVTVIHISLLSRCQITQTRCAVQRCPLSTHCHSLQDAALHLLPCCALGLGGVHGKRTTVHGQVFITWQFGRLSRSEPWCKQRMLTAPVPMLPWAMALSTDRSSNCQATTQTYRPIPIPPNTSDYRRYPIPQYRYRSNLT